MAMGTRAWQSQSNTEAGIRIRNRKKVTAGPDISQLKQLQTLDLTHPSLPLSTATKSKSALVRASSSPSIASFEPIEEIEYEYGASGSGSVLRLCLELNVNAPFESVRHKLEEHLSQADSEYSLSPSSDYSHFSTPSATPTSPSASLFPYKRHRALSLPKHNPPPPNTHFFIPRYTYVHLSFSYTSLHYPVHSFLLLAFLFYIY